MNGMIFDVKFSENGQSFEASFGEVIDPNIGLYERGYEEGYEDGTKSAPDYLSMRLNGTLTEYSNESVTEIPNYGFYGLSRLEKIDLPNATRVMGNGLMNCTGLRSVNLPQVVSLGNYAFQGCSSIETLDLPSLSSIQGSVFTNMNKLAAFILRRNMLCSLGNKNSFNNTPIASGTGFIYVPDNLVEQYKAAVNWSTFANQIKPISELEVTQ